jgi:hypothetical protein
MLYTSDKAGADAVYLRPFPNANAGKWRVSGPDGGGAPRWRADGKELNYIAPNGQMMAVTANLSGASPQLDDPRLLFRIAGLGRAGYAVSRDGARFLLTVVGDTSRREAPLSVVLKCAGRCALIVCVSKRRRLAATGFDLCGWVSGTEFGTGY